jgi:uncharacterized membrane protein
MRGLRLPKPNLFRVAVLILACVTAVLLFTKLGLRSIWLDELFPIAVARAKTMTASVALYRRFEVNPPFNYVLLYGWIRSFGSGDATVRVPSAILGVCSV